MKKVIVITSGGDGSGMNAFLKTFVELCEREKIEVLAGFNGYNGLINDVIEPLTTLDVENIFSLGGSIIGAGRCKDFQTEKGFERAIKTIKKKKADCVVVLGGNGSFKGATSLANAGIKVVLAPGTIDNDFGYTDFTLGYDTAVNNSVDAVNKISESMKTLNRGLIVETMGRNCADITISTAVSTNANVLIIEKMEFADILEKVKRVINAGISNPIIVVKEYLLDVQQLAEYLQRETQKEWKNTIIGYLQRGGTPSVNDRLLATQFAVKCVDLILNGKYNRAVGIRNNKIMDVSLKEAMETENVDNLQLLSTFKKLNNY